jgi:hypothetical protein
MSPTPVGARAPRVSAVIVAHDGERWLPHLLSSLDASTRMPDEVVAVDTSSGDGSAALLEAALGAGRVAELAREHLARGGPPDRHRDAGFAQAQHRVPEFEFLVQVLDEDRDSRVLEFHGVLLSVRPRWTGSGAGCGS